MIPYGKVKTKNHSKNGTHKDCPICDPAKGNKKKARQKSKKVIKKEIKENPYIFYDPFFD